MSFALASASSMQRVFRDRPFDGLVGKPLQLAAAMRGWVSGQVVIIAGEKKLRNVRVEVKDLTSWEVSEDPVRYDKRGNGEHDLIEGPPIPGNAFELARVHYVEIEKPCAGKISLPGGYPDPLEPMTPESRFEVEPGMAQPIWLRMKVPPDTRARNKSLYRRWYKQFRGPVVVHAEVEGEGEQSQQLDIELRVFKFNMPKRRILRIWTNLDGSWMGFYNWLSPEENFDVLQKAALLFARFKISPTTIVPPREEGDSPDLEHYERFFKKILDLGVSHLQIDADCWPVIVGNGWEDIAYRFFGGETPVERHKESMFVIRERMKTTPLAKAGVSGSKPSEFFNEVVDVWIHPSDRSLDCYRENMARGDEVEWYSCCRPEGPYANFQLDCPQIDPRIICWQLFQYGVSGFHYWRATQTGPANTAGNTPEEKWPNRPWDPATSPVAHSHNDGCLMYPGPGGEPWSSIRLENLRDGAEDYDYLCILRDYVAKLKKAGFSPPLVARAENALLVNPDVSACKTEYTKDPAVVERERRRVCAYIEEARTVLGELGPIFPSGFSSEE